MSVSLATIGTIVARQLVSLSNEDIDPDTMADCATVLSLSAGLAERHITVDSSDMSVARRHALRVALDTASTSLRPVIRESEPAPADTVVALLLQAARHLLVALTVVQGGVDSTSAPTAVGA